MNKVRLKIGNFFAYFSTIAILLVMLFDIFIGINAPDSYDNALKIISNADMYRLDNYSGKVAVTGVLTFDSDSSKPESEQYIYILKKSFVRTVKKNVYTDQNEIFWTSTTEAPVFGNNLKINGLSIDSEIISDVECNDYGITEINGSRQYQIFGIRGNHIPVTILGTMKNGSFNHITILSTNTNMSQVIASQNLEDNSIYSYSTDFVGLKFISVLNSAIIICFLLTYVFLQPIINTAKKKHIVIAIIIATALIYEITSIDTIEDIVIVLFLLMLVIHIKGNKLAAFPCWISAVGLYNGLTNPLVLLPARFISNSKATGSLYQMLAQSVIFLLCIIIYFTSENWRKNVSKELKGRSLVLWQKTLAFFIGLLMFVFNLFLSMRVEAMLEITETGSKLLVGASIWIGLLSLVLSATVIAVITNASRQFYYHSKVSDMQFNIIVMMAEIVENRDSNTGGHIQRTAQYVEIIARELKKEGVYSEFLTDKYIEDIKLAATLHDIGKIHVSDVILNKEGNLTDEEFAIMKSHASEGRKLLLHAKEHLGDFDYLNLAADMAGYHHEWWDGSDKGYPEHLKGDKIPLCARIMAVADVFDALTSRRIYKNPMPIEKAYLLICEQNGTHFDPTVIQAFCNARLEIKYTLEKVFRGGE